MKKMLPHFASNKIAIIKQNFFANSVRPMMKSITLKIIKITL